MELRRWPGTSLYGRQNKRSRWKLTRYTKPLRRPCTFFERTIGTGTPPGSGCEFTVEIRPDPAIRYTIALPKVEQHAQYAVARGPSDIMKKQRLRQLLGVEE